MKKFLYLALATLSLSAIGCSPSENAVQDSSAEALAAQAAERDENNQSAPMTVPIPKN